MTENREICALALEQFLLGELSGEEREHIREMAAKDPGIARRIREIEDSNRAFLSRFPAAGAVAQIESRAAREQSVAEATRGRPARPFRKVLLALSPALAAAILLLVFLQPWRKSGTGSGHSEIPPDAIVIKGSPLIDLNKTQLLVYRLHNQRVELLKNWQVARFGDLLQLAYVSAGESHGMIFSIDGRGGVSLHFPRDEHGSTALARHQKSALPEAIELDDAPGFERFFFLTSDFPIDVAKLLKMAGEFSRNFQKAGHAEFTPPNGVSVYSIMIQKGETP
jgi:hypothetical protein